MHQGRRLFLKGSAALMALAAWPRALFAAAWPKQAFAATEAGEAVAALLGKDEAAPSDRIAMKVPEIAENGAVVPVTVSTTLEYAPGTLPDVSSRIKMGETSEVIAIVKTDTGLFRASKEVKVTIGGCGG